MGVSAEGGKDPAEEQVFACSLKRVNYIKASNQIFLTSGRFFRMNCIWTGLAEGKSLPGYCLSGFVPELKRLAKTLPVTRKQLVDASKTLAYEQ